MAKRSILRQIYEKTKGRCWYCGTSHRPFDDWQVEHQVPRIRGGSDHIDNLVLSCSMCNAAKGKRTVEEYRTHLKARLENHITSVREDTLGGIEGYVGWEHHDETSMHPPDWLMDIDRLLEAAAEKTVYSTFAFYGETLGWPQKPESVQPQIIQAETLT